MSRLVGEDADEVRVPGVAGRTPEVKEQTVRGSQKAESLVPFNSVTGRCSA